MAKRYDPIMCMMVDDSVETKDANKNEGYKIHKAEIRGDKLYLTYTDLLYGGKETESFTKSEAKGFLTDPWNTWEGNTKSVMMKFVKDSKTIDSAIRSCDANPEKVAELFKSYYNGRVTAEKLKNVSKSDLGALEWSVKQIPRLIKQGKPSHLINAENMQIERILKSYGII